jgi:peptidoglycan hydrolase CwlO-like protein
MNLLSRFNRSLQWRKNSQIFIGATLLGLVIAGIPILLMKDLSRSTFLSNPFIASLFNEKTTLDSIEENIKSLENKQLTLEEEMNSMRDENINFLKNKQLLLQEEVTALRAEQSTLKSELDILKKKIGKHQVNDKSSLSDSPN